MTRTKFFLKCMISEIEIHLHQNLIYLFSQADQSLSRVWLFVTPWTAARQASLSIANTLSLFKLMSIESVMPSSRLILCHPLLLLPSIFPSIRVFSNESALHTGGKSIGVSASASFLPMNIQDWFPLRLTAWISLQSKGLSRVLVDNFYFSKHTHTHTHTQNYPRMHI